MKNYSFKNSPSSPLILVSLMKSTESVKDFINNLRLNKDMIRFVFLRAKSR
jgi:ribosomal protein S6